MNSIAGEEPLMGQWGSFWDVDVAQADQIFRQALVSHIVTAKHVAPHMIQRRRGLIVEVTESDILGGGGNPLVWSVKLATKGLALNMAAETPRPQRDGGGDHAWVLAVRGDARWPWA